ncbi:MAG: CRTAC1 family protein [Oceanipulchritudo sp.]
MKPSLLLLLASLPLGFSPSFADSGAWRDITSTSGLGQHSAALVKFANLNNDRLPDVVLLQESRDPAPPRVFVQSSSNRPGSEPSFFLKTDTGLPALNRGDSIVFADLDNDGHQDAIIVRYLDIYQDDYEPPAEAPTRTGWLRGNGDGTFSDPAPIEAARLATGRSIAVNDVNEDGLPDLFIGNWYERYFSGYEGFANDLLLQYTGEDDQPDFVRWPMPNETRISDYRDDLGGRPTYGTAMPRLDDGPPMLLELNYGRRWNRLYRMEHRRPIQPPRKDNETPAPLVLKDSRARGADLVRHLRGENIAAEAQVDGDAIRHGRHPSWPHAHAEAQPRSLRSDEAPFRSNGNTFDVAVGDIDNDGDFDLFLSTIIHAWAGESSDRSRFLVNQLEETGSLRFFSFEHLSVDRIPEAPAPGEPLQRIHAHYNQGDIFAELADLNHDGRLDLVLCSSDYPDPPPHDERLRIYFQQEDGRFRDVTASLGLDHVGAGMPSLADVDNDGDLDLIVGQSFNRLTGEQRRAAALTSGALAPDADRDERPRTRARLFLNESAGERASILLELVGDPSKGTSRDAYGTIVRLVADLDGDPATPEVTQQRQVLGPAGHAGKQHQLDVHFGLGDAERATAVEIIWPGQEDNPLRIESLEPGHYRINQADNFLTPLHP